MIDATYMTTDHTPAAVTASHSRSEKNADPTRPAIIHSGELLHGARELWIEHGPDMYRLRVTSSGKLYLTK